MAHALAYFLTWTTYGTWLHGDVRGSVDDSHSSPNRPLIEPNQALKQFEARSRVVQPFMLNSEMRSIVAKAIEDHCAHRSWELLAANVRSNHVHVVVSAGPVEPERVMGQFKSWATRRLRDAKLVDEKRKHWTRHGSTRYVWDRAGLTKVLSYVELEQDRAARFMK